MGVNGFAQFSHNRGAQVVSAYLYLIRGQQRREGAVLKTLVEDEELLRLRAMAEGRVDFKESGLWSKLAALPWAEIKKLPARERLGIGYFEAARRRVESLRGAKTL
jgi:hypothetical protein